MALKGSLAHVGDAKVKFIYLLYQMFFTKYKNELRVGIKIRVVNRSDKDVF